MWKFVILFCIRLQFGLANDIIPEMEVNVVREKGELKCHGTETNLLHNSLYRVHINTKKNIYHARCYKQNEWNNAVAHDFRPNIENRPGYISMNGSIVTQLGEWYLECFFYTNDCWTNENQNYEHCYYSDRKYLHQAKIVKCYIPVKVLPVDNFTSGLLTVDEFYITAMARHNTRKHYVKEGNSINITCKKNVEGYVTLAYTNKERDSRIFSTLLQSTEKIQQYMKVTAADNDAKITCTIYNKYRKIFSDITVTLIVEGSPRTNTGVLGFVVNGFVLPRIASSRSVVYNYKYKYYHTEPLNISFVKDEKMYRDEYCVVKGNAPNSVQEYFRTHTGFDNNPVLTTVYQGQEHTISCTVHTINGGHYPTNALIQFLYKPPDYTPFISGLTKGNIMMALKNDTTTIIYYNYDENGLHDLRCFDDEYRSDAHTTWDWNPKEMDCRVDMNNLRTLKLLNFMSSVITCTSKLTGKVTHLKLIRKEALDTTITTQIASHEVVTEIHTDKLPTVIATTPEEPTPITPTIKTHPSKPNNNTTTQKTEDMFPFSTHSTTVQTDSDSPASEGSKGEGPPIGALAAVGVVITALLVAALSAVVIAIKKIKKARQVNETEIDYQNLPQHNEGPMPLPAQWNLQNDYTVPHNENNLEQLYAKPIPKIKRSIALAPEYAQVRDVNISEPTYAEVVNSTCDSNGNEPAYAEVGKSNYQNFVKNPSEPLNYANVEAMYSQVSKPLNPRSLNYIEIKSPESSYANVQELRNENETLYAEIKD